jgi:hypothetical protein
MTATKRRPSIGFINKELRRRVGSLVAKNELLQKRLDHEFRRNEELEHEARLRRAVGMAEDAVAHKLARDKSWGN